MSQLNEETIKEKNSKYSLMLNIIFGISILGIIFYYIFSSPIRENDVIIHIASSDSLAQISKELDKKSVISHPFIFKLFVSVLSDDKKIPKGDYLFKKGESLFGVVWQVSKGQHGVDPIRVTFKEGITKNDMALILTDKISNFRKDLFLTDDRSREGYLFPDTYFFYSLSTTDEILNEITNNFNKRISKVEAEIKSSGHSMSDIIIMASILEKEAKGKEDGAIISGILWKRIKLGMPLQVDAAPSTYEESGLPNSPISNPGLSSIDFAINPKESPYLFYLHDKDGKVHYAEDFSEHRSNIARFLK